MSYIGKDGKRMAFWGRHAGGISVTVYVKPRIELRYYVDNITILTAPGGNITRVDDIIPMMRKVVRHVRS